MENITLSESEFLEIIGAKVHNLKNIDVKIPRNKLVVFTGLSGSGKSSLAFDTIYAEGQRRFIETFSAYARQFLGNLEKPDVDKISGLSPVISIEQKTVNKNPRSTVGTITEIYDFLRLLYARAGIAYSYNTGKEMIKYSEKEILNLIIKDFEDKKIAILAPIVKGRKGHYRELFEKIRKLGFVKAKVDGEIIDITGDVRLDRYKVHDIDIVIDRLSVNTENIERIKKSIDNGLKKGKGTISIQDLDSNISKFYSKNLMCSDTGIAYDDPAPNLFSYNSPYGACTKCNGLGEVSVIDIEKIIPNNKLSIKKGAISPIGTYKNNWIFYQIESILKHFNHTLDTPVENIDDSIINLLLYGGDDISKISIKSETGIISNMKPFEGIVNFIEKMSEESGNASLEKWAEEFKVKKTCTSCNGTRLKKEALYYKLDEKNISEVSHYSIGRLKDWIDQLESKLDDKQKIIGKEVIKEIRSRIGFLLDVGLDYLSLSRQSRSLSGGEAQRIRLATQIGSQLVGVLYILDEPSIGLHQRDNEKLIAALTKLRDIGNSVIVVEHDKDMMLASDYILDIGPGAGINGGNVVAQGTPSEIVKTKSTTANYLNGKLKIELPKERRSGNGKFLELLGTTGHNLKNVDLKIPLGKLMCVSGVSGSGKSSLIIETLYPILHNHFYRGHKAILPYKKIKGIENIDKVIEIDQSPIGRTPKSNPATYTGIFADIRNLFTELQESKIRGYKPGRFSFNVKGGRCEDCKGAGLKTIEMNFLPDVYVECPTCYGKRYNRETLEVRYRIKNINDVLELTIDKAVDFFENIPSIHAKIKTLQDVGLGYIKLGQQSTTLSGGEAQRIKIATELSKKETGNTFYILDEPSTGLHFEDIRILMKVINRLVDNNNTVLIIEHNLDIIKLADYVVDIGPEGGEKGGEIVAKGTPEEIAKSKKSITGKFLAKEL
jgi:excinuclease ABC subunit A